MMPIENRNKFSVTMDKKYKELAQLYELAIGDAGN